MNMIGSLMEIRFLLILKQIYQKSMLLLITSRMLSHTTVILFKVVIKLDQQSNGIQL